jgi:hypothetical protein
MLRKTVVGAVSGVVGLVSFASPALAHDCTVPNKPVTAGAKAIIGQNDEPIWLSPGVEARAQHFDEDKFFSTLHGWIAFDFTGDGTADAGTFLNTPEGVVPAAERGGTDPQPCNGITNLEAAFDNGCVGG